MTEFICKLFGHNWRYVGDLMNRCRRCKAYATDGERFGKPDRYGQ